MLGHACGPHIAGEKSARGSLAGQTRAITSEQARELDRVVFGGVLTYSRLAGNRIQLPGGPRGGRATTASHNSVAANACLVAWMGDSDLLFPEPRSAQLAHGLTGEVVIVENSKNGRSTVGAYTALAMGIHEVS